MLFTAAFGSALCFTTLPWVGRSAAEGAPPVEMTSGPRPSIRLGDQCIPSTQGTLEVPIFVKNGSDADGFQVTIDYDEVFLGYAWYRNVNGNGMWRVERVAPYGQHRVVITLRRNGPANAVRSDQLEEVALSTIFYLKEQSGAGPPPPSVVDVPLSLGSEIDGIGQDSFFFLATDQNDRYLPIPTEVHRGSLAIYFADGVEAGSGELTRTEQTFELPLLLTYVEPQDAAAGEPRTYSIGIDYDEVFLGLSEVRGLRPPLEGSEGEGPIDFVVDKPGHALFTVTLDGAAAETACRVHIADLQFRYNGLAPPEDHLLIQPSIVASSTGHGGGVGPVDGPAGDPGAGASPPQVAPAVLNFLPPYFVRGNSDSSVTPDRKGGLNARGDSADVLLTLRAVFLGGSSLPCADAADMNNNGKVELSDAILLLEHLFRGGAPPPAPYPDPGIDPGTADNLGCDRPVPYFVPMPGATAAPR